MSDLMLPSPWIADPEIQANFEAIQLAWGSLFTPRVGIGDPNGVILGSPPDLYLNLSGGAGATLWVKESGSATNTGWIAK